MSAYVLYCTVCKETFESRESWLTHLLTESHQICARRDCTRWGKKEKKCVIVVFSDKSMKQADSLLEYFSLKDFGTIVTDFVWWPDKDQMGLMQFESKAKVKEVLRELGNPVLQLPDCFVQLKRATTYLDLEWSQLICKGVASDFTEQEDQKPKLLENGTAYLENADVRTVVVSNEANDKRHEKAKITNLQRPREETPSPEEVIILDESDEHELCNGNVSSENHIPIDTNNVDASTSIWSARFSQFNALCKSVEIRDGNWEQFKNIVRGVSEILGTEYEVNMYRNWFLKLRNPGSNILLLHMHQRNNSVDSQCLSPRDLGIVRTRLLDNESKREKLPGFKRRWIDHNECNFEGTVYTNTRAKLRFAISSNPLLIVEVQMCRMLEYLCTFDARVRPLLGLVYVWAKGNNIHLAEESIHRSIHYSNVPEPAALEWLVILLLCKVGVLPTVREIQERPHEPLLVGDSRHDIGFKADPEFVKEWKTTRNPNETETCPIFLRVLILFKQIFKFINLMLKGEEKWLLNPKDGEFCTQDEFFSEKSKSKLTDHEVSVLKGINENLEKNGTLKQHLIIKNWKIYMIHPLYLTRRLSVCNECRRYAEVVELTRKRMEKLTQAKFLNDDLDLKTALISSPEKNCVSSLVNQKQLTKAEVKPAKRGPQKPAAPKNKKLKSKSKKKSKNLKSKKKKSLMLQKRVEGHQAERVN